MSRDVAVETLTVAHGAVPAVRAISFTARRGELLTLLGPSGCGKTTTLRAIAGLETPRQGRIAIGGNTVFDAARSENLAPERRGLAMMFQSYAIWPHMTVFETWRSACARVAWPAVICRTPSGAASISWARCPCRSSRHAPLWRTAAAGCVARSIAAIRR